MPALPQTTWLAVTGGLALAAIVLLLLWLSAVRRLRVARRTVTADHAQTAALEVSVADQGGRLRIIRELHDIAVGRISAMVVQAEGAQYAGSADPGAAVRATGAIADLGRSTLADLRRVMTLVRERAEDGDPQPTLPSTRDLLVTMREAGLRIRFEEAGEPYALEAGAELAVHRILQEAMANSLQHGGEGTAVLVALTWTASGLAVRIDDDGFRTAVLRRGLSPEEVAAELAYGVEDDLRSLTQELSGAGIGEMRARTELFGGSLTATETPGVGFSIVATFPSIRFHNGVHGVDLSRR